MSSLWRVNFGPVLPDGRPAPRYPYISCGPWSTRISPTEYFAGFTQFILFGTVNDLDQDYLRQELNRVCDFIRANAGLVFDNERNRVEEKFRANDDRKAADQKILHARLYLVSMACQLLKCLSIGPKRSPLGTPHSTPTPATAHRPPIWCAQRALANPHGRSVTRVGGAGGLRSDIRG